MINEWEDWLLLAALAVLGLAILAHLVGGRP